MKSKQMFAKACQYIPGGVNSPVRAFRNVDMVPVFIDHSKNSKVYDVDGKEYIDYIGSWGPLILGHSNDDVGEDIYSHVSIEEKLEAIKMITYKEQKKLYILASNQ